jgi:hypothetical protein
MFGEKKELFIAVKGIDSRFGQGQGDNLGVPTGNISIDQTVPAGIIQQKIVRNQKGLIAQG